MVALKLVLPGASFLSLVSFLFHVLLWLRQSPLMTPEVNYMLRFLTCNYSVSFAPTS